MSAAPGNGSGNGEHAKAELPAPLLPPPSLDLPAAPEGKTLEGRDPKTGRILPGHSLNPRGRPQGIPNRNTAWQKTLDRFKADESLAKVFAKKIGLSVSNKKAEQIIFEIGLVLAAEGQPGLLETIMKYNYIALTPEAAGIKVGIQNNVGNSYEQIIAVLNGQAEGDE